MSQIRFSGMASGLDTEKIVKELMKAESAPLYKLQRTKQKQEWQQTAYREINTLLLDLRTRASDLRYESFYTNKKAVTSSADAYVSVKSSGKPSFSSYTVAVNKLAEPATGASAVFKTSGGISSTSSKVGSDFSFTINSGVDGKEASFTVSGGDTVEKVINDINAKSGTTGVKASFFNNQIVFSSTTAGAASNFTIGNVSGTNNLGIGSIDTTAAVPGVSKGKDLVEGEVVINGATLKISSNNFTYDNMQFSAKQLTAANSPVSISVTTDVDSMVSSIKEFIDKYNSVIDTINKKLTEDVYKSYQPLIDSERSDMTDDQISKWEDKAKSGILRRDSILSSAVSSMRSSFNTSVPGLTKYDNMSKIGITTKNYYEKGKLYVDEDKLREALTTNPDEVIQLLTKLPGSSATTPEQKFQQSGVFERLYSQINDSMKQITEKAGSSGSGSTADTSTIGLNLKKLDLDIDTWEDRLAKIENRYWKQYTAMETAISKFNSQGGWFANLMQ